MAIFDKREIWFDAKVLVNAVASSLRMAGSIGLPPLRPTALRFYPAEEAVEFRYEKEPIAVRITAAESGSFLVSYCVRERIPLPRLAAKKIRVEAGSIILSFETHYNGAMLSGAR